MSLRPIAGAITYPNVVVALRMIGARDELQITAALTHIAEQKKLPAADRQPLDLEALVGPFSHGRARDVVMDALSWSELSLLVAACIADNYLPKITKRISERARVAIKAGKTVKEMFDDMRRGRAFDEDTQTLFDVAAESARSSAGKEVA